MDIGYPKCTISQQGGRKLIFYGGATVNSEKIFFKNSQNLLNKSPKDGGAIAPPAPPAPPPLVSMEINISFYVNVKSCNKASKSYIFPLL